ncbi:MAG: hypothetical protein AAF844_00745 [Pseudomonadota bacterium]
MCELHHTVTIAVGLAKPLLHQNIGLHELDDVDLILTDAPVDELLATTFHVELPAPVRLHQGDREAVLIPSDIDARRAVLLYRDAVEIVSGGDEVLTILAIALGIVGNDHVRALLAEDREHGVTIGGPERRDERVGTLLRGRKALRLGEACTGKREDKRGRGAKELHCHDRVPREITLKAER